MDKKEAEKIEKTEKNMKVSKDFKIEYRHNAACFAKK